MHLIERICGRLLDHLAKKPRNSRIELKSTSRRYNSAYMRYCLAWQDNFLCSRFPWTTVLYTKEGAGYEKKTEQPFLHREDSPIKYAASFIVTIILLVIVLGALMLNTIGLYKTLRHNAVDYGNDVSTQLASSIAYRMESRETYIQNLADTFAGMPEFLLTGELLDRKAEYLELDDIFVVNADGTTIPANEERAELSRLDGKQ